MTYVQGTNTIRNILKWAIKTLKRSEIESPEINGDTLLAYVLSCDKARLYTNPDEVIDDADRVAEVCRGVFNGGELFLGVYWMDGAEVVGPCKATPSWPVEYRGLSKADAITWLEDYCGW